MDTQKDEHEIAPRKVSDVFSYYDWTDGNVIYRLNSHKGMSTITQVLIILLPDVNRMSVTNSEVKPCLKEGMAYVLRDIMKTHGIQ